MLRPAMIILCTSADTNANTKICDRS